MQLQFGLWTTTWSHNNTKEIYYTAIISTNKQTVNVKRIDPIKYPRFDSIPCYAHDIESPARGNKRAVNKPNTLISWPLLFLIVRRKLKAGFHLWNESSSMIIFYLSSTWVFSLIVFRFLHLIRGYGIATSSPVKLTLVTQSIQLVPIIIFDRERICNITAWILLTEQMLSFYVQSNSYGQLNYVLWSTDLQPCF